FRIPMKAISPHAPMTTLWKSFTIAAIAGSFAAVRADELLIDAESFSNPGGWVVDQQSMDQMGSPYLMAHGLGEPVADARTSFQIRKGGKHRIWVRTRDWVGKWKSDDFAGPMKASGSPGIFHLVLNARPLEIVFGEQGAEWHWQDGGT